MSYHYLIIYSVTSGGKKFLNQEQMVRDFFKKNNIPYTWLHFNRREQSPADLQIASRISQSGATRLVVVGGDGTLRAIVEELYHRNISIPVGFIPGGSANVYALVRRIPLMTTNALEHMVRADPRSVPIALLNDRHVFLISACFGRLAEIALRADIHGKKHIGFFAYVIAAVRYSFSFPHQSITYICDDKECCEVKTHSVLVFLSDASRTLIPEHDPFTKGMQAYVFHNVTIVGLLRVFCELYILRRRSARTTHLSSNVMNIRGAFRKQIHLDGDVVEEETEEFRMKVVENALQFLC
ncbi:hypothetical protein COU77_03950 [Candidatus Peregrinibacteria bacterium CG10_big_fil_rev_8_21_14_0_10_49_16]|nr:MAG: hypothetical protein COW95_03985 [Candidatus Peregrinibacteria bacterium CG22_combo_CG10-13_8_21_14_all_49_11]PIR51766.1 MAG: hypothetical protein COU77_03950 [Candidatus Peregrinibacteria bacterium CG10_big_fil_rev_8_21_14_0_10_49_16]